mmetsp:Transcript_67802/g.126646  ORF Transcript_67802/g.126646 Transcript_67802/m.126646 type:complete len:421 (+) Transcript_67802:64-1326(+)
MSAGEGFKPFAAYIVDACRTAGGKRNGRLSGYHPADLGAVVCDALVERTKVDASQIEDVIFGCVSQSGAQAGNIGRNVVLASRLLPESVPGTACDRQCGSGQQALHFAAQAVMSGVHDCVIAGGVEVMSTVPIGSNVVDAVKAGHGDPMSEAMRSKYATGLGALDEFGMSTKYFTQFGGAELLARKYDLSKEEMDRFGVASQQKAAEATKAGRFSAEIVPVPPKSNKGGEPAAQDMHRVDEGIRASTNYEAVSGLKPLHKNGRITPATSSQICDGSSAMLICNERGLERLGLRARAKIHTMALAGTDPVMMLEGPIPASKTALGKAGLKIEDIDVYEVNEAFAPVPLSWCKALGADINRLNVNGGAMALGHPLGSTGTKLMTTLLHELERRKARYGMLAICEGGGTANATIIERVPASKL